MQSASMFGTDKEGRPVKKGGKSGDSGVAQRQNKPEPEKDRKQMEKESRKFRGKRNSIGAKMAKFRGGIKANYKTGGIGDKDLTGKSKGMQHVRGGFAPVREEAPVRKQPKGKSDEEAGGRRRRNKGKGRK